MSVGVRSDLTFLCLVRSCSVFFVGVATELLHCSSMLWYSILHAMSLSMNSIAAVMGW